MSGIVSLPAELLPAQLVPQLGDYYNIRTGQPLNAFVVRPIRADTAETGDSDDDEDDESIPAPPPLQTYSRPFNAATNQEFTTTGFATTLDNLDVSAKIQISIMGGQFGLSAFAEVHKVSADSQSSVHIIKRSRVLRERSFIDMNSLMELVELEKDEPKRFGWKDAKKNGATHVVIQCMSGHYLTMDISLNDTYNQNIFGLSAGGSGTASYSGITGTISASVDLVNGKEARQFSVDVNMTSSGLPPYEPRTTSLEGKDLYRDASEYFKRTVDSMATDTEPMVLEFYLAPVELLENLTMLHRSSVAAAQTAMLGVSLSPSDDTHWEKQLLSLSTRIDRVRAEIERLKRFSEYNDLSRWAAEASYFGEQLDDLKLLSLLAPMKEISEDFPTRDFKTYQQLFHKLSPVVQRFEGWIVSDLCSFTNRVMLVKHWVFEMRRIHHVHFLGVPHANISTRLPLHTPQYHSMASVALWDGSEPDFSADPDAKPKNVLYVKQDGEYQRISVEGGGTLSDRSRAVLPAVQMSHARRDANIVIASVTDDLSELQQATDPSHDAPPPSLPSPQTHWLLSGEAIAPHGSNALFATAVSKVHYLSGIQVVYAHPSSPPPLNAIPLSFGRDVPLSRRSMPTISVDLGSSANSTPDRAVYLVPVWSAHPQNAVSSIVTCNGLGEDIKEAARTDAEKRLRPIAVDTAAELQRYKDKYHPRKDGAPAEVIDIRTEVALLTKDPQKAAQLKQATALKQSIERLQLFRALTNSLSVETARSGAGMKANADRLLLLAQTAVATSTTEEQKQKAAEELEAAKTEVDAAKKKIEKEFSSRKSLMQKVCVRPSCIQASQRTYLETKFASPDDSDAAAATTTGGGGATVEGEEKPMDVNVISDVRLWIGRQCEVGAGEGWKIAAIDTGFSVFDAPEDCTDLPISLIYRVVPIQRRLQQAPFIEDGVYRIVSSSNPALAISAPDLAVTGSKAHTPSPGDQLTFSEGAFTDRRQHWVVRRVGYGSYAIHSAAKLGACLRWTVPPTISTGAAAVNLSLQLRASGPSQLFEFHFGGKESNGFAVTAMPSEAEVAQYGRDTMLQPMKQRYLGNDGRHLAAAFLNEKDAPLMFYFVRV